MKTTLILLSLLIISPLSAQVTQGQTEKQDAPDKEALEGIEDELNRKNRWQCNLSGGKYAVRLSHITSISQHTYVLDGTLLVTEVTIDTTGTALARFYYIEPITNDTNFNALARIQKRAKELGNDAQKRSGTKADEMAQKNYPTTTHARTIEFRIMNEVSLNALYQSAFTAWDTGKGRTFSIQ